MGRLTFWETWPGGLRGGLGGDDRGSQKDGQRVLCVDGDVSNEEHIMSDGVGEGGRQEDVTADGKRGREADDSIDEDKVRKRGRKGTSEDEESFVPLKELKKPPGWSAWEEKREQKQEQKR